jgi:hypothetical protein
MMRALLMIAAVSLWATTAGAQVEGNDTGGIIPWSCENEALAQETAAAYCARWDKYHRITGVQRQIGNYISFNCLWSPHVNRYALPAVPTRATCFEPRLWPQVKVLN